MSVETSKELLHKLATVLQRHKVTHSRDFLVDTINATHELLTEYAAILIFAAPKEAQSDALADLMMVVERNTKAKMERLEKREEAKKKGIIEVVKPKIEVVPS
jgi:hypothetical protein